MLDGHVVFEVEAEAGFRMIAPIILHLKKKSIEVFNLQAKQRQKLIMISRIKYSTSNSLPFNLRNYSRHSIEYW